ncbi:MAG: SH3 domain-containing protein [Anaerolineae bacterium]|nr:SH3 domain-containing protein [Anaerolineae bacterium]
MKYFVWGLTALLMTAWLPGRLQPTTGDLPDYGPAPELSNEAWLNADRPLRLADLRGQVVLLEMWTFDCINCIRTIPYVQQWHETYEDEGLVVIGNHYPEFSYERDLNNIRASLERLGITYAVAQDNDRTTWSAYNNRYWPTIYLIDKQGRIRYRHIGEGAYDRTEQAIQTLLAESYTPEAETTPEVTLNALTPTEVLNVRAGADVNSERVGSIQPGDVFVVLGEENGWYQINYNGDTRYVFGEYVSLIE